MSNEVSYIQENECQVCSKYQLPTLAVDAAVINEKGEVLMIKRKGETFKGYWAFPGGRMDYGESPESGVLRELKEECNLDGEDPELIGVFGKKGRDPRKHTVSIFYYVKVKDVSTLQAGDDAGEAKWIPVSDLQTKKYELAFDHSELVRTFVDWQSRRYKNKKTKCN
jgi:8-oxo-dGTP diphosphatase